MKHSIDDNELLLPWLANETLSGQPLIDIQQYIDKNPEAALELEFVKALRIGITQEQFANDSPNEAGLQRLQDFISQEKAALRGAGHKLDSMPAAANDNFRWKACAAAAALVIMIQSGLLLNKLDNQSGNYQTLSVEQSKWLVLQVEFQANATELQIRNLLSTLHAEIVSGPSALGIYRLRFNIYKESSEQSQALIEQLRQADSIISYVEQN